MHADTHCLAMTARLGVSGMGCVFSGAGTWGETYQGDGWEDKASSLRVREGHPASQTILP